MSNVNISRRTSAEICFDGVDITKSVRPYLLSLTYTDNEEDEADDLQINLADRDGLWLCQWLNDMVQAAASTTSVASSAPVSSTATYQVTAKSGLNVRSGPGTGYSKLGALAFGESVNVESIQNGWAVIQYSGRTSYVCADYIQPSVGGTSNGRQSRSSVSSLKIRAGILRGNWNGDGSDKVLDCGQFELDRIDASGPPATVTIKATALPFSSQIRQTKRSQAWESYTLSGIAREMAARNGMAFLYESASDPYYDRVEQVKTSDISFLSALCHNAGISLKATSNILVLFDQRSYESKAAVKTIRCGDGSYTKYKLAMGKANTQYASCRVSYSGSGKCIEATAYVEDYKADSDKNQQLEITARVGSVAEAKAMAEKQLRLHNKYARTATFTMTGDPDMLAGVTVQLADWGSWDGKYIVKQARHTVGSSGYTTVVTLRRVLEGY
ncbi:MAG: SH3 domain-containing protein [Faecousia sp.]